MTYWDYDIPIYGISGIIVIVMTIVIIIIHYGNICSPFLYQLLYQYYYTTIIPLLYTVEHILLELLMEFNQQMD